MWMENSELGNLLVKQESLHNGKYFNKEEIINGLDVNIISNI